MSIFRACTFSCHFVIFHTGQPDSLVRFCLSDITGAVFHGLENPMLLFSAILIIYALPISRNVPHQWGFDYGWLVKPLDPEEI